MPRTKGAGNIAASVRRAAARDALRGQRLVDVAREHGITPDAAGRIRDEAARDPEGAMEEAREELEFRREVYEITGGDDG